ncbi:MAG: HAMP domain-containing histidine kinase [Elusimicrobia bacterium]|nr:HAMP domain-containing histidine kinase [Elusimicrobiota bacterium]
MSLGVRFTLWILAVMAMTGGVMVGGFLGVERGYLLTEGRRTHQTNTDHLAQVCAETLVNNDELGLMNFLKELRKSTELDEAYCVDGGGKVLAHTNLAFLGQVIDRNPAAWMSALPDPVKADRWTYQSAALRGGRPAVFARSVFRSSAVKRMVGERITNMVHRSIGLGLSVLGLALLSAWGTARTMTRPIRKLSQGVRRVGGGDWTVRVPDHGPGELGDLAREFNTMSNRLGDLDRLKDEFIHNVSHDLRNPLSAIATSAKMLRTDNLPPSSAPVLKVIESAALRLRTMVNNILDTAKMREGRLAFDKTEFSPHKLLEDLFALYTPMAEKSGKKLVLDLPADLPPLHADEEKILRIFLNLLSNAFKFTKAGDEVGLSGRAQGSWVEFRVWDTGWGISPERLPALFKPFHSTDEGPNAPPQQGTGLGLSIVKVLVEGHGGRVSVASTLGKGTSFTVLLPAAREGA